MDELTQLLTELEAPPDAVWMRVMANALDPSAAHGDLADLVPDAGDFTALPADSDDVFGDSVDEDDPGTEPGVWADDLESPVEDLDGGFIDADPDPVDLARDPSGLDQDPDVT